MKRLVIIVLFVWPFFWGCLKVEEASPLPKIDLQSINVSKGLDILENPIFSITLTLAFIDGDGDIGSQNDTVKDLILNLHKFFLGIDSLVLRDSFKIPYIEPVKTVRTMTGEIEVKHDLLPVKIEFNENDTVYYQIHITDRAGNQSNLIKTNNIILVP